MSEEDIKISLRQIKDVLTFVKVAASMAFAACSCIVGIAIWVNSTDTKLNAATVAISEMQHERRIQLKEIQDEVKKSREIEARLLAIQETQQRQLELLTQKAVR